MSQIQKFLYTYASKPLVDKDKEVPLIPNKEEEKTSPNVRRLPICVDRFAGFSKQSDVHLEDHSSCIYCDVEPEAFWQFLYSDEWDQSAILRVFPGELFDNMDLKLSEMLRDHELSRHVTCAYLKVNNKTNNMKFNFAPETVRIEFTYYGKNLERRPRSTATTFTPAESLSQTLKDLYSDSEDSPIELPTTDPNKLILKKLAKSLGESFQPTILNSKVPKERNMININLAHFYCLNSLEIKENIESECDMLEIKLKGMLGVGRESIGSWDTTPDEQTRTSKKVRKMRKRFRKKKYRGGDGDGDGDGEYGKSDYDDSDDDNDDNEGEGREGGRGKKKKETEEEKGKEKKNKNIRMLKKKKKGQICSGLFESQEPLMSVISSNLAFGTIGKILEGEKFLKFHKMTAKRRKKFLLTDERIAVTNRKLMKMKLGKQEKGKRERLMEELHSGRTQILFKRISSIPDVYEFALMVLGVTDSYELFRTILWMAKGTNRQAKWREWYEKHIKPRSSEKSKESSRKTDVTFSEKRSKNEGLSDRKGGDGGVSSGDTKRKRGGPVQKTGTVNKDRKDPRKDPSKDPRKDPSKDPRKDPSKDPSKDGKQKRQNRESSRKAGQSDTRGEKLENITKRLELASQILPNELIKGEEEEEEEEEEEFEETSEIEELETEKKPYDWEIRGDELPVRLKTEIVIPDFRRPDRTIRIEMILKAMDDFIIRKERVTSSKEFSFTSLAFIRPPFAHKLFQ